VSDWQSGDLAICVDASPCKCGHCGGLPMLLIDGASYAVVEIGPGWLEFPTKVAPDECWECNQFVASSSRFRKIRPDEHAPCEEEFVELLNLSKRKVTA
jgi:hypothetical protein